MLTKVGLKSAAGVTAVFGLFGASLEWTPVQAVPVSTHDNVASVCAKIDAQTYGYCCKLRLEPTCPTASVKGVLQSTPLNPRVLPSATSEAGKIRVAESRDNDDLSHQNPTSVFVLGNTTEPGRGLGANNGGNGEAGDNANMGGSGDNGGGTGDNGGAEGPTE